MPPREDKERGVHSVFCVWRARAVSFAEGLGVPRNGENGFFGWDGFGLGVAPGITEQAAEKGRIQLGVHLAGRRHRTPLCASAPCGINKVHPNFNPSANSQKPCTVYNVPGTGLTSGSAEPYVHNIPVELFPRRRPQRPPSSSRSPRKRHG